jgi:hypothetical protein
VVQECRRSLYSRLWRVTQGTERDEGPDAEDFLAYGSDDQPAESNVLTGSDNQELRVEWLPLAACSG